jgi:TRAP-type uncharacterized transport system fused permease subunit
MSSPENFASLDEGKSRRVLTGWWRKTAFVAAVLLSAFQVYTAAFGILAPEYQRGIHYASVLFLLFFLYPAIKSKSNNVVVPWYDVIFALASVAINLYPIVFSADSIPCWRIYKS